MTSLDEDNANTSRGFEALAVILLSLATVGAAWCSYQASGWTTRAGDLSIQSASRGRDAAALRIKANQMITQDTLLFGEYLKASRATDEPLAEYYRGKFSSQLKRAHEAWKARGSPANDPLASNFYEVPLLAQADAAELESKRLWNESNVAGDTSHHYILISVLLAMSLFFFFFSPKFQRLNKRRAVLALGLGALMVSVVMFLTLPKSTEGWFMPPKTPSGDHKP